MHGSLDTNTHLDLNHAHVVRVHHALARTALLVGEHAHSFEQRDVLLVRVFGDGLHVADDAADAELGQFGQVLFVVAVAIEDHL
jgi:hypothetical protein